MPVETIHPTVVQTQNALANFSEHTPANQQVTGLVHQTEDETTHFKIEGSGALITQTNGEGTTITNLGFEKTPDSVKTFVAGPEGVAADQTEPTPPTEDHLRKLQDILNDPSLQPEVRERRKKFGLSVLARFS